MAEGQRRGLMRNVSFMGQVPHLEIIRLLDGASALVHPALEETFGNIFLEAAGRKVPCIGGKEAGAIPDVLGHGKYGCLCDVTSAESLKDAMQKVVTDHAYRDSLVAKAFSNLMANYAEGVVAQKHIDIYRKYIWGR